MQMLRVEATFHPPEVEDTPGTHGSNKAKGLKKDSKKDLF